MGGASSALCPPPTALQQPGPSLLDIEPLQQHLHGVESPAPTPKNLLSGAGRNNKFGEGWPQGPGSGTPGPLNIRSAPICCVRHPRGLLTNLSSPGGHARCDPRPFTDAESEVQRGGLGQQAGDPQNQGVNPDLPDASASVRVGGKADAWVPRGCVATRYPKKPRLGPIPGLAELTTSMTSASSRRTAEPLKPLLFRAVRS